MSLARRFHRHLPLSAERASQECKFWDGLVARSCPRRAPPRIFHSLEVCGGQAVHGRFSAGCHPFWQKALFIGLCGSKTARGGGLFTPVENTVDKQSGMRKPPSGGRSRVSVIQKQLVIVTCQVLDSGGTERRDRRAIAYAIHACGNRVKSYPHRAQFACGNVHKKTRKP
jgi:hypothetical protein